ncbi:DNA adenine methylase [Salmonella phage SPFM6]|nr:DNA adenine methylase [Salmonella phage SPFM6]
MGRSKLLKQQAADGNKVVLSNADTAKHAQYHSKEFSQADHRELDKCPSNAVIYADPPYIPLSDTKRCSETNVELLCADFRDILMPYGQHPNGVYFPEEEILAWDLTRHGYNGLCRYNQSGGFNEFNSETTTGKPNLQRAAMFL